MSTTRFVFGALIFLLMLLAAMVALMFFSARSVTIKSEPFVSTDWQRLATIGSNGNNDPGCYRGGMAQDLIERQLAMGKTRAQLISLLGQPDQRHPQQWWYAIGQCGGDWGDHALVLAFSTDGRVETAEVKPDQ